MKEKLFLFASLAPVAASFVLLLRMPADAAEGARQGLQICAAVIVYLVAAILTRAVTREDLSLIPGGEKIATFLHIR